MLKLSGHLAMGTYMRVLLLQYLTFLLLLIIWSYFLPHTDFPRKSSTNQVLDSVFQRSIWVTTLFPSLFESHLGFFFSMMSLWVKQYSSSVVNPERKEYMLLTLTLQEIACEIQKKKLDPPKGRIRGMNPGPSYPLIIGEQDYIEYESTVS